MRQMAISRASEVATLANLGVTVGHLCKAPYLHRRVRGISSSLSLSLSTKKSLSRLGRPKRHRRSRRPETGAPNPRLPAHPSRSVPVRWVGPRISSPSRARPEGNAEEVGEDEAREIGVAARKALPLLLVLCFALLSFAAAVSLLLAPAQTEASEGGGGSPNASGGDDDSDSNDGDSIGGLKTTVEVQEEEGEEKLSLAATPARQPAARPRTAASRSKQQQEISRQVRVCPVHLQFRRESGKHA